MLDHSAQSPTSEQPAFNEVCPVAGFSCVTAKEPDPLGVGHVEYAHAMCPLRPRNAARAGTAINGSRSNADTAATRSRTRRRGRPRTKNPALGFQPRLTRSRVPVLFGISYSIAVAAFAILVDQPQRARKNFASDLHLGGVALSTLVFCAELQRPSRESNAATAWTRRPDVRLPRPAIARHRERRALALATSESPARWAGATASPRFRWRACRQSRGRSSCEGATTAAPIRPQGVAASDTCGHESSAMLRTRVSTNAGSAPLRARVSQSPNSGPTRVGPAVR